MHEVHCKSKSIKGYKGKSIKTGWTEIFFYMEKALKKYKYIDNLINDMVLIFKFWFVSIVVFVFSNSFWI